MPLHSYAIFEASINSSQFTRELVRPAGLEPATPCLEGRCSIHLSYGRMERDARSLDQASRSLFKGRNYALTVLGGILSCIRIRSARAISKVSQLTGLEKRECSHRGVSVRSIVRFEPECKSTNWNRILLPRLTSFRHSCPGPRQNPESD
jgi:hypothetical protein